MRKWYIAQTYSGSESSVKNDIEARIQSMKNLTTIKLVKNFLISANQRQVYLLFLFLSKKTHRIYMNF